MDGHDLRRAPVLAGVDVYLEQRFGSWTVPGGLAALGVAMADRLALRGRHRADRHAGDATSSCATAGSRRSGPRAARSTPTTSSSRSTRGGCPPSRRTSGARCLPSRRSCATWGSRARCPTCPTRWCSTATRCWWCARVAARRTVRAAWTVLARGLVAEDVLTALARHGLDVRGQVVARVDRTPRDLVEAWGGSPHGVQWQGPRTARARLGPRTPIAGVLAAGAHATTGSGLPFAGLSAALVAEMVGRAPRQPRQASSHTTVTVVLTDASPGARPPCRRAGQRHLRHRRRAPVGIALDDRLHGAESRAGHPGQLGGALARVVEGGLAGAVAGPVVLGDLQGHPVDRERVADLRRQVAQQRPGGREVRAARWRRSGAPRSRPRVPRGRGRATRRCRRRRPGAPRCGGARPPRRWRRPLTSPRRPPRRRSPAPRPRAAPPRCPARRATTPVPVTVTVCTGVRR